jgi:hypothetical protein
MHLRLAPSLDLGDNPRLDLETVLFGGFEEDLPTMRKLLVVTFAVLIMACLAQADTFYATRAAWLAATTGVSTVDFEGITSFDVYYGTGPGAGVTLSGVNFAVGPLSNGSAFVVNPNYYFAYGPTSSFSSQQSSTGVDDLLITLPTAVTALAFDYGDFQGYQMTFTLSDGTVQTVTSPAGGTYGFFGVTGSAGILTVDITQPSGDPVINIDNFSWGSSGTTTPEPGTLMLLGSGLAGAGMLRRRLFGR